MSLNALTRITIHLPPSPQITSPIPKRFKQSHELPSTLDDPAFERWRHCADSESRPSPVSSATSDSADFSLTHDELEIEGSWNAASDSDAWCLGVLGGPETGATTMPVKSARLDGGDHSYAESYPSFLGANSRVLSPPESTRANTVNASLKAPPNWRSAETADLRAAAVIAIQSIWGTADQPTPGAPAAPPLPPHPLPLERFLAEILHRSQSPLVTVQLALYYLHKGRHELRRRLDAVDTKSKETSTALATPPSPIGCGRRMFLASLVLATKFLEDRTYSTRGWGKIAGLGVAEISAAERTMLQVLQYELCFSGEHFKKWLRRLALLTRTLASTSQKVHPTPPYLQNIPPPVATLSYHALPPLRTSRASSPTRATANPAGRPTISSSKSRVVLPVSPPEFIGIVSRGDVDQRRISGLPKKRKSGP